MSIRLRWRGIGVVPWLGHVCLSTTNIYAEVDLEMKTKALANCEVVPDGTASPKTPWRADNSLMEFLRRL
jgi:hypothetical protein